MRKKLRVLDQQDQPRAGLVLDVATPCDMAWEDMQGDDRVRHCWKCDLDVFNVASLTTAQALGLIEERTGRVCVRLLKRADGTVVTRDCADVLQATRRHGGVGAFACVAALVISPQLLGGVCGQGPTPPKPGVVEMAPVEGPLRRAAGSPRPLMGEVVAPPPVENVRTEEPLERHEVLGGARVMMGAPPPVRPLLGKVGAPLHRPKR